MSGTECKGPNCLNFSLSHHPLPLHHSFPFLLLPFLLLPSLSSSPSSLLPLSLILSLSPSLPRSLFYLPLAHPSLLHLSTSTSPPAFPFKYPSGDDCYFCILEHRMWSQNDQILKNFPGDHSQTTPPLQKEAPSHSHPCACSALIHTVKVQLFPFDTRNP